MARIKACGWLLAAFLMQSATAAYGNGQPTARDLFSRLPMTIFENTAAGLDEISRQTLLQNGTSGYWEILDESQDAIVFAELPFRDNEVALRLFRNEEDGSIVAAIGTLGAPVCTVELWREDVNGRIMPIDAPAEPDINEFFKHRPEKAQQYSVLICLGLDGLRAKPVFWNEYGVVEPRVDNEISFKWTGKGFEKVKSRKR